jgi:histidinol-phosphatase
MLEAEGSSVNRGATEAESSKVKVESCGLSVIRNGLSMKMSSMGEGMGHREEYGLLLEDLAKEADAIAMRFFRAEEIRIDRKDDGSAVTQADRSVEAMARAKVAASGLAMDVLGEEMGGENAKAPATTGRARLIIDPIDGTEEFSRGISTFGTLLGIERDGEIVAGMASAPALGVRWWAYRGEGAWRNARRIHVSKVEKIEKMMRLLDAARHGRSLGGFWQHMLVAEGSTEAALDLHSKPWDLAPLGLIVEEAGGRATDVDGKRSIYSGNMVSTNGKIHDEVLALLQ